MVKISKEFDAGVRLLFEFCENQLECQFCRFYQERLLEEKSCPVLDLTDKMDWA
jgi:hypothetical protein